MPVTRKQILWIKLQKEKAIFMIYVLAALLLFFFVKAMHFHQKQARIKNITFDDYIKSLESPETLHAEYYSAKMKELYNHD